MEVLGGRVRRQGARRRNSRRARIGRTVAKLITNGRHAQIARYLHIVRHQTANTAVLALVIRDGIRRLLPSEGRFHFRPFGHLRHRTTVRRLLLHVPALVHRGGDAAMAAQDRRPQLRRCRTLRLEVLLRFRQNRLQNRLRKRRILIQIGTLALHRHLQLLVHLLQIVEVLQVPDAAMELRVLLPQLQHLLHKSVQFVQMVEGLVGGDDGRESGRRPTVRRMVMLQRLQIIEEVAIVVRRAGGIGRRCGQFGFVAATPCRPSRRCALRWNVTHGRRLVDMLEDSYREEPHLHGFERVKDVWTLETDRDLRRDALYY